MEHIRELLDHLDDVCAFLPSLHREFKGDFGFEELHAIIWFHDIVYVPGAPDNEERSAVLANELLVSNNLDVGFVCRVIRETKTHHSSTAIGKLFNDMDMAILGSSPERYQRYTQQIREEFKAIPDDKFIPGRLAFLQSINGSTIFKYNFFDSLYSAPAQDNIAWEIDQLKSQL